MALPPLTPQPGDVWPGPLPPDADAAGTGAAGQCSRAGATGARLAAEPWARRRRRARATPSAPPEVTHGSSTPPGSNQPGLAPLPPQQPSRRRAAAAAAAGPPGARPGGADRRAAPGVTTGGTQGYQTMTMPGGGTAIVVPNGNGTSTVIKSDGSIETIPTPK